VEGAIPLRGADPNTHSTPAFPRDADKPPL
jgi:hypothetical protein